ncbi:FmdB family transcriptional regulator [Calidifontibacter sp. DB0510]|uniref:FmdB family transcriptional regulator n=1 Tax=Metallococcus carri TaxID=1656884 RepID=A0A967E8V1_9MICO|nr:FmdB family zinc ribbon protein [Metallococcus carri]NHN55637.1 FmdB family transcriptional regulator [Metallococcus carri]NOP38179.1 FmdB family transcriptional regulator [Calidifontibacter sp. DB2511S]
MPTYAYACKDCGHSFEIVQSFSDNALTQCPECGGHLRKVFNSVGVVFKGSGFYRTDSRSSSGSSASTDSAKKPSEKTSSDAKPAETKSSDSKASTTPKKAEPSAS